MAKINNAIIKETTNKPCVYRYVDMDTGVTKYVGIVHKSNLEKRLVAHASKDWWAMDACWKVEYFECENRSEAEAFESHLIALYGTHKYYNKAKTNWGINKYLPDVENWWRTAVMPKYADMTTLLLATIIRKLIKAGKKEEVLSLLELIEIERGEYGEDG